MASPGVELTNVDLVKKIASSNTQFGLDVYKKLAAERKESNLFLSPFSISAALGMTFLGARGDTASQMRKVLKWTEVEGDIHHGFEEYLRLLKKAQTNYVLTTANRLFVNSKAKILPDFLTKTEKHYSAKAVSADFVGNGDGEAKRINEWVESETNSKIKDLISGGIDPLTAMILVNAIYFKGNWADKFEAEDTVKGKFKVSPGREVETDMMHMSKKFRFGRSRVLECDILELPYVDGDLSMFFLLPNEDFGLSKLEQRLDQTSLDEAITKLGKVKVDITMPTFKIESSFNLNDVLKSLGMSHAFDETRADLSGIDGSRLLYISQVVHKAFLEVNEEGSEAAAATAVRIMSRSLPIIEPFKADHPFLFLIRDNRTGVVLFMGRFMEPNTASSQTSQKVEL